MLRVDLGGRRIIKKYGVYRSIYTAVGGIPPGYVFTPERYADSILLYALIPAYFLGASSFCRSRSELAFTRLRQALANVDGYPREQFVRLRWMLLGALIGLTYGAVDVGSIGETRNLQIIEWTLRVGNALVWASVGALFAWRFCYACLFLRMGEAVRVDLLDLNSLKPLGRVASFDVFLVMGALAMMPLQSFSSEFHWEFYRVGFAFGIPAAVAFLILPQLGAHRNIRRCKAQKLRELQGRIGAADGTDIAALEALLAHRDRIAELPEWPIDTRAFSRTVFYLVVPPLAWVGAAIVERGVDQLF
jgi:hypothetical protein